ncbi:MAG TPA: glycosyltransferase family 1 protein [Gemmatimonadaceae bacterium]|nr:glycosyltransferase family 1 protein [Gemmatimonadaceae bacterium]
MGARCRFDGVGPDRIATSANLITLTVPQSLHHGLPSLAATGERPLRVAFDLWPTRYARGGSARYAMELSTALSERSDVDVVTLGDGAGGPTRVPPKVMDTIWYPFLARRAAGRARADLLHCPSNRAPLRRGSPPLVVTIHDLVSLRFPETMATWNRSYLRHTLPRVAAAADRVIAVSGDTANDLERLLHVPHSRIRVVPNGIQARFFGTPSVPTAVAGPYILFVGTIEPRKNLPRLVEAYRMLRRAGRAERLVIVGARGWNDVRVDRTSIELLGRVSDGTLHALYASASCLVIPSLHEGFGVPVVEAMAAGCPVVAASAGALPEVCGDAAVLVDPLDPRAIAAGIERAIADADSLRIRGRARAESFRWPRVAASVAAIYRELA